MNSSLRSPHRFTSAGLLAFSLICAAAGMLALILTTGLPQAWWPHTGKAFTPTDQPRQSPACALVMGAAGETCERHADEPAGGNSNSNSGSASWLSAVPAVGLVLLAGVRCRVPAGRRRG
ncbi:hypothetical protein [Streptomyces sp. NPDC058739]|uniref:hypothetical protein n=1 Tax=Streptomyces sp. NPDC058739 TaxID=3346618 RepID=UPI003683DAB7